MIIEDAPFSREDFWRVVRLDSEDNETESISLYWSV